MKPIDPAIIDSLNKVLKNELTAINQYFLHAKMLTDWGFEQLGKHEMDESIDEMKHADQIIERILFLDGLPNLQALGRIMIGEHIEEMLECDLRLEMTAIPDLREGVKLCEQHGDFVTRQLLREILSSEEQHVAWIETQLGLIGRTGQQNYLQSQMG